MGWAGWRGWRDRDALRWREEAGWWRGGGLIGASLPAIAPHSSDVICHSKKHFGGQMFSLSQVPATDQYRSSVCKHLSALCTRRDAGVCAEAFSREGGENYTRIH